MVQEEKLKKVCDDFSLLNEEQQEYILGILQALVFAKSASGQGETDKTEGSPGDKHS
ncbi:MAG: hypothetical protein FWD22_04845 [Treponema sp.]|nr:hypothetical protein [Treponema sp.]